MASDLQRKAEEAAREAERLQELAAKESAPHARRLQENADKLEADAIKKVASELGIAPDRLHKILGEAEGFTQLMAQEAQISEEAVKAAFKEHGFKISNTTNKTPPDERCWEASGILRLRPLQVVQFNPVFDAESRKELYRGVDTKILGIDPNDNEYPLPSSRLLGGGGVREHYSRLAKHIPGAEEISPLPSCSRGRKSSNLDLPDWDAIKKILESGKYSAPESKIAHSTMLDTAISAPHFRDKGADPKSYFLC